MINVKRRIAMKSFFSIFLLALVALCGLAERGLAQTTRYNFRDPASEIDGFTLPAPAGPDGNYFLDGNWYSANGTLRFIPDYSIGNGEVSFIENGGTAIVNTDAGIATGQLGLGLGRRHQRNLGGPEAVASSVPASAFKPTAISRSAARAAPARSASCRAAHSPPSLLSSKAATPIT